ncbi:extracellular catalytic domain type 1 short-chain-length polyhydroxyalkanoate depolymerase [Nocardia sp. CA-107356]|uniref:extracellular catalytic domain type 1 short-chain-length polyhydroxyalkanoate depolymerase n=1 Tax=Nocardia sp. CA-107356 TaxID=3239972 RepID=UPI003D8EBC23
MTFLLAIMASIAVICVAVWWPRSAWATPSGDQVGELQFGGLLRTYVVHAPLGGGRPSGLVVALHGGGGTGRSEAELTHYSDVADAHGFVVVYPDGVDKNWADGRGASEPDRRGIDDVGFITALADKLVHDYGIDPGRVFATGMSNGGFMANRLGCDRADVFAAIAPVAGTLGVDVACHPTRPVAVMATHGTADPIVPFNGGTMIGRGGRSDIVSATDLASRWRELDACPGAPGETVLPGGDEGTEVHQFTAAECASGTAVEFMQVDNGGHTWPGGSQYLPKAVIGATTHAFDAADAGWQFFDAHAR